MGKLDNKNQSSDNSEYADLEDPCDCGSLYETMDLKGILKRDEDGVEMVFPHSLIGHVCTNPECGDYLVETHQAEEINKWFEEERLKIRLKNKMKSTFDSK